MKETDEKTNTLFRRFEGAITFIRKQAATNKLPWYLLIGSNESGKTCLLANANINFILSKQFKKENLFNGAPSEMCDWWVTRDLVIVDVPSSYLSFANPIWTYFLSLLKKFRGKKGLSGIVLAVSIPELIQQKKNNKDHVFDDIKLRISELQKQFGENLPVTIVITKCDLLSGFVEFFADSDAEELSQSWGITIPPFKNNLFLQNTFNQRFNVLIKRLNKQLLWRLHQERNPFARPYIKDFPLQVERLRENLLSLIKNLTLNDTHFNLQSVYLSSALQLPKENKTDTLPTSNDLTNALQIMKKPLTTTQPYFIKQLLLKGLLHKTEVIVAANKHVPKRKFVYGIAAAIMVVMAGLLGSDFTNTLQQTHAIHYSLAQYHDRQFLSALPLLNALEEAANKPYSVFHYSDKASQSAKMAYHKALNTIVLGEIKRDFESYLQTSNDKTDRAYTVLKAYLMLGDATHMQREFVLQTLQQINPELFKEKSATHYINTAFNLIWHPMNLDENIITAARRKLNNLAPAELANIILKNMQGNDTLVTVDLGSDANTTFFASNGISNQIPKMFTAANFQTIYNQETSSATTEVLNGSWVLGKSNISNNNSSLLDQLRALYVANYIDVWESLVANIHLASPNNLIETQKLISEAITYPSPVSRLLNAIHTNTSFAPILASSVKLNTLNQLATTQQDALSKSFAELHQILNDIQKITSQKDIDDASFNAAQLHIKNDGNAQDSLNELYTFADKAPEPLQQWLKQIANLTWHYEMLGAANNIAKHWNSDVMQPYHKFLENRFPLFPLATNDIPINQFEKFLGAHGTLTQFYQHYLAAFVDNTDNKLQWKKINNQSLPFSENILASLITAANLQRLYFPQQNDSLSFKFTLQPLWVEKQGSGFSMVLNGQPIEWQKGLPRIPENLTWPGNLANLKMKIALSLKNHTVIRSNVDGDWGWLRVVNASTPQIVSNHQMTLTFNVNGHRARYMMFTDTQNTPFILTNAQTLHLQDL